MRRLLTPFKAAPLAATAIALPLLSAATAWAHGGGHHHADDPWWARWNADPLILANLALISLLYFGGLARIWRRAGVGQGVSRRQAAAFAAALAALVVSLLSPVDVISDELSWMHMVQHMTLMMVAAPLFILGAPAQVMLWSLPQRGRLAAGRMLRRLDNWRPAWYLLWHPALLWLLYAFTLWIWHLPALYQAALRDRWVHELQHLTFFVASCLFWRVLLDPLARLRMSRGAGVLYLFTTSLHATVLGVFMALSPVAWYEDYQGRTDAWSLTILEDQQLAGLIMWMPACMVYAVAAAALFALWLHEPFPESKAPARLRQEDRPGEPAPSEARR